MSKLVQLGYKIYEAATISRPPLLMFHGLFGSKQNWHSVSRQLARLTNRRIYAVDLPNHGDSKPRTDEFTMETMARDFVTFLNEVSEQERALLGGKAERIEVDLLGHSLGGTISMITALKLAEAQVKGADSLKLCGNDYKLHFSLNKLIIVDMSPLRYERVKDAPRTSSLRPAIQTPINGLLYALRSVDLSVYDSQSKSIGTIRRELDTVLERRIPDRAIRLFLLNAIREVKLEDSSVQAQGVTKRRIEWQFNLEAIARNINILFNWPDELAFDRLCERGVAFNKPTLFLAGALSDYVHRSDLAELLRVFPRCELQYVPDAGHWVAADKPHAFCEALLKFIDSV